MKLRVWLQRYGSAEVAGIAGTFGGFYLSRWFTANPIVSAYAGALGENVGFYGFIIGREIYSHLEKITDRFEDVANEIQGLVLDHA